MSGGTSNETPFEDTPQEQRIRTTLAREAVLAYRFCEGFQQGLHLPDDSPYLSAAFIYATQRRRELEYVNEKPSINEKFEQSIEAIRRHIPDLFRAITDAASNAASGQKPELHLSEEEREAVRRALEEQAEKVEKAAQTSHDSEPGADDPTT